MLNSLSRQLFSCNTQCHKEDAAGNDADCVASPVDPIISGFPCRSGCSAGQLSSPMPTCENGNWESEASFLDLGLASCSAASVTNAETGAIGITGAGCDFLTSVNTTCTVVCADGQWGGGNVTCTSIPDERRLLHSQLTTAAANRRLMQHRASRFDGTVKNPFGHDLLTFDPDPQHSDISVEDELSVHLQQAEHLTHPWRHLESTATTDCGGLSIAGFADRIGDGSCDSLHTGSARDFFCALFNFDGGDCPPETYGRDCDGNLFQKGVGDPFSYFEHFLGDGICDDGSFGPNFNCPILNFDEGDCQPLSFAEWVVTDPNSFQGCSSIGSASDFVPTSAVVSIETMTSCQLPGRYVHPVFYRFIQC